MKELILLGSDKYKLCLHIFDVNNPKAVVQIAHGMEEHQERYEHLAKFLNENGFAVVSADMRGHGKNAKTLGYFKAKDGDKVLVSDQLKIANFIRKNYDVPLYLFSHSMGTMISRVLLQTNSDVYDKVIFSGAPCYNQAAKIGLRLASIICKFNGERYRSTKIQELSYKVFNKKIKKPATDFDWICKNKTTVKNYLADPLCGFGFTSSGYRDLFKLNILMNEVDMFKSVNKTLPMLFLWGSEDPCAGGKRGVNDSISTLKKAGFENIRQIEYRFMRHELINEENYEIVFNDILSFFAK